MRPKAREEINQDRRGTSSILAATVVMAISVLAFHAVGSRTLGDEGFSPIAVLWTVMFLLHTVLLLPAEQHLTRALVVSGEPKGLIKVRRDMLVAAVVALVSGVLFVFITRDRFFEGSAVFALYIGLIVVARAVMVLGRGFLAGTRRFAGYGASIAIEAVALVVGGIIASAGTGTAQSFALVMVLAPAATLLVRPFRLRTGALEPAQVEQVSSSSFLLWLVLATGASQLIIAGGPIAVGFAGGGAASVSVFFTSFALLRGPLTSAYNFVARVLPDFTAMAHGSNPGELWRWAGRIGIGGVVAGGVAAIGAGLLLRPVVSVVYGSEFMPPLAAAILGGAGVGLGLGALFATQLYTAAGLASRLAAAWFVALFVALVVVVVGGMEPVSRVALAFTIGEGVGLVMLSGVLVPERHRKRTGPPISPG